MWENTQTQTHTQSLGFPCAFLQTTANHSCWFLILTACNIFCISKKNLKHLFAFCTYFHGLAYYFLSKLSIWTYTYHTPVFFVACNYWISQNHSRVSLCGITSGVVYYSNIALCRASTLIDLILMMGYTFIFKKIIFRNSLLFIPQLENAVYCSVSLAYSVCIYNWNLKAESLNNSIRKHIVFTVLSMNSNDHIIVML